MLRTRGRLSGRRIGGIVVPAAMILALALVSPAAAAVTVKFAQGILIVEGDDADDTIVVTRGSDGFVKVNGLDRPAGPIRAVDVDFMDVLAGDGNNVVDLSAVNSLDFPNLVGSPGSPRISLTTGAGNDDVTGSGLADFIILNGGVDRAAGGAGGDEVWGDGYLFPGTGENDNLRGGPGDDDLQPGAGTDLADGGDGNDRLYFAGDNNANTIGPGSPLTAGANSVTYQNIEALNLFGGGGADTLTGLEGDDILNGGPGDDDVDGGDGNDGLAFFGTFAGETIEVGTTQVGSATETDTHTGIDYFFLYGGGGNDTLRGGPGNDLLQAAPGPATIDGGAGDDMLFVDLPAGDHTVTLPGSGTIAGQTFAAIESFGVFAYMPGSKNITTGGGDDFLTGSGPLVFDGGAGDDTLDALPPATLRGGPGADRIFLPADGATADGMEGSDSFDIFFDIGAFSPIEPFMPGASMRGREWSLVAPRSMLMRPTAAATATVSDSGTSGRDVMTVNGCFGVTVSATQVARGTQAVDHSGLEELPCGFAAPQPPAPQPPAPQPPAPQPPAPQPPAPQPPAPQPPAPQPKPRPKAVKKVAVCHNGRTRKLTGKQIAALRKQIAKANKKKGVKKQTLKLGACKKKPKRR